MFGTRQQCAENDRGGGRGNLVFVFWKELKRQDKENVCLGSGHLGSNTKLSTPEQGLSGLA